VSSALAATALKIRRTLSGRVTGWTALAALVGPLLAEQAARAGWFASVGATKMLLSLTALVAAPVLGLVAAWLRTGGLGREGTLHAEGQDLVLLRGGRKTRIPRAELVGGHVIPASLGSSPVQVEIELRGGRTVSASVASLAKADELLDELDLEPALRTTRITLTSELGRILLGLGLGVGVIGLGSMFVVGFAINVLGLPKPLPSSVLIPWIVLQTILTWVAIRATAKPEVVVGADGVELVKPFGRREFLPFDEVERVDTMGDQLTFLMKSGRRHAVLGSRGRVAAVLLRVREAMAARAKDPLGDEKRAVLAREGRSVAEWRSDLGRATRSGGYREAPLSEEDLEAILAVDAAPEQTVAAALALATAKKDSPKLRIAAERTADPRLRVALEGIANGEADDAAIEEALAARAAVS